MPRKNLDSLNFFFICHMNRIDLLFERGLLLRLTRLTSVSLLPSCYERFRLKFEAFQNSFLSQGHKRKKRKRSERSASRITLYNALEQLELALKNPQSERNKGEKIAKIEGKRLLR